MGVGFPARDASGRHGLQVVATAELSDGLLGGTIGLLNAVEAGHIQVGKRDNSQAVS
ncbi:hypothetical protein PARPLA_01278 [Rhodobacteraceae bacterium THAF1]|nr:hypothetical protein FIU81_12715 [Palleronia sp. THAF1]VDC21780.1 hypothetical protein PARPLA_01278 [Rhodobacteraceae bacterium THAF1]